MKGLHVKTPPSHRAFKHCAEELLRYKSRYYRFAERFLAELAGHPAFCMTTYDVRRLSHQQRQVLSGLLQEQPTPAIARSIIGIVSDVMQGEAGVDEALLEKYATGALMIPSCTTSAPYGRTATCADEPVLPAEPLQNMASRLGIPLEVKGNEVRVRMRVLARYLDSPNPTIRRNLQDCILRLQQGGYRLVNERQRPPRKIEWDRHHGRLPLPVVAWQLLLRWTHLQKKNARQPVYSRTA